MSRAKTQPPRRGKRAQTPATLGPIDEEDVDAAFAGIRLESDVPIEIDSGADFAPDLADLAEVKKADSPTRRAQTLSEDAKPAPALAASAQPAAPKPLPSILASKIAGPSTPTGPVTLRAPTGPVKLKAPLPAPRSPSGIGPAEVPAPVPVPPVLETLDAEPDDDDVSADDLVEESFDAPEDDLATRVSPDAAIPRVPTESPAEEPAVVDAPAYPPRRRAKRASSIDEPESEPEPLPGPPPLARAEAKPRPISEPPIQAVDTKLLESIRLDSADDEFDYAAPLTPDEHPRPDSALERALRDSSIDMRAPSEAPEQARSSNYNLRGGSEPYAAGKAEDDDDLDFALRPETIRPESAPIVPTHPLPRVELGPRVQRDPSVSDSQLLEVEEVPETPQLQLAVFETAAHLQSASLAIAAAGHAMAVGASGKDGLAKIQRAISDGHIDAVIVGMPGGEAIIETALGLAPYGPVVIAACSGKAGDAVRAANAAGAELVAIRPHDAERVAPVLLAAARILEQRRDLALAAQGGDDLLERLAGGGDGESEVGGLQSFETFQRALELELKRVRRYQYALSLALFALEIPSPPPGIKGILRARAGNAILHSIRDIDMATELDQDRFLVLLPYTDLTGATEVARRIIGAVGAIAPVVAGGQELAPRLVGAIAGTKPGQQLSFTKLVRDATRALEAARRDGAELAVQP